MENQEVLKAIATLVDKVSRYHERLLQLEREKERLSDAFTRHLQGCSCHNTSDAQVILKGLDSDVECEACSAYFFLEGAIKSCNLGAKILTSLRIWSSLVSVSLLSISF